MAAVAGKNGLGRLKDGERRGGIRLTLFVRARERGLGEERGGAKRKGAGEELAIEENIVIDPSKSERRDESRASWDKGMGRGRPAPHDSYFCWLTSGIWAISFP